MPAGATEAELAETSAVTKQTEDSGERDLLEVDGRDVVVLGRPLDQWHERFGHAGDLQPNDRHDEAEELVILVVFLVLLFARTRGDGDIANVVGKIRVSMQDVDQGVWVNAS